MVLTGLALSVLWVAAYSRVDPAETVLMGMRARTGALVQQHWVDLDAVSPHLVRAVIAAEDSRFCSHHGFDLGQIRIALREADGGKALRGASTITQQTAKNAFLWPGRSFARKGAEAWFAALMEVGWSKRRIMEVYVNVAEWGDGYFGIEAAAQGRFGKSARDLTAREAALLAAVLPDPTHWRVDPPGPYVSQRATTLQRRMATVRVQGLDQCVLGTPRSRAHPSPHN